MSEPTTKEIKSYVDIGFFESVAFPPNGGEVLFDQWLVAYNRDLIARAIEFVDSTPAVTWTGKGGVKERLNEFLESL